MKYTEKPGDWDRQHRVLTDVVRERMAQNRQWGEQNHADGTGAPAHRLAAERDRDACKLAAELGRVTWRHILTEEVSEALAEADPARLRAELVQVAAVVVAWIEAIDRRGVAALSASSLPAVIVHHIAPGESLTTCCRRTVFELSRRDLLATDVAEANCKGSL